MTSAVERCPEGPWFNEIAAFLGKAYWAPDTSRVMAFTKGTEQEVEFLVDALGLAPGMRVLDVGLRARASRARAGPRGHRGPRRRPLARLRRAGPATAATEDAAGDVRGARRPRARRSTREFDAAICLCQGGFGLLGGTTTRPSSAASPRPSAPGGGIASARSRPTSPCAGSRTARTSTRPPGCSTSARRSATRPGRSGSSSSGPRASPPGSSRSSPRGAGLEVDGVHGVSPGDYGIRPADPRPARAPAVSHGRHRSPVASPGSHSRSSVHPRGPFVPDPRRPQLPIPGDRLPCPTRAGHQVRPTPPATGTADPRDRTGDRAPRTDAPDGRHRRRCRRAGGHGRDGGPTTSCSTTSAACRCPTRSTPRWSSSTKAGWSPAPS